MANLRSFFIIFTLILSNLCHVHSQTTIPPTKTPTTEPTSDPTLEPTLNPLFVLIPSTIHPSAIKPSPSHSAFIQENYVWLIISASALICICLIVVVFVIHNKAHSILNSELKRTNAAINNEQEEQQPINTTTTNQAIHNHNYNNIYGIYQQQFDMQQMQRLRHTAMQQQYQHHTNFQTPQSIAAYQALEFCPPINHDGNTWKSLSHLNPQQRMLQLMQQQQYIQQMANQAAVAMAYFLQQQQQMHANANPHHQHNNNNNQAMRKQNVAALAYIDDNMTEAAHEQNNSCNDLVSVDSMQLHVQHKKQRLDTMDTAALTSDDLPPSVEPNNEIMFAIANEPESNMDIGGDKIFYQLQDTETAAVDGDDHNESNEERVGHMQLHINDGGNKELIMVPPPNPMEIQNLNVPQANSNMAKVGSLSSEIPDLPFGSNSEATYNAFEYNEEYEPYHQ